MFGLFDHKQCIDYGASDPFGNAELFSLTIGSFSGAVVFTIVPRFFCAKLQYASGRTSVIDPLFCVFGGCR